MSTIKLYDSEWLVYVERGILAKCEYWVLRRTDPSPLYTRHKVRRKHIAQAVALFKDHPDGIKKLYPKELHYFRGLNWSPQEALEHKAEVPEAVDI